MTDFLSVFSSPPLHKLKQDGNENEGEVDEQTFKEKELDRKLEDVPPDVLTNERYKECVFCSTQNELKYLFQCYTLFVLIFIMYIYFIFTVYSIYKDLIILVI